jgi:putative transposase
LIAKATSTFKGLSIRHGLKLLDIPKSRYYRLKNQHSDKDLCDFKIIEKHFLKSARKAGIRQLKMILERKEGIVFNRKKIARIKKKFGLQTEIRKKNKHKHFALRKQEHEVLPNVLSRKFSQNKPKRVYSIDITQVRYSGCKAYIAAVKDLCTKEIVAKEVSSRIDLSLTNRTIAKALEKLTDKERKKLMIHSDQGVHFTHESYRKKLKENGVTQSMSRKGNCLDNAPIESFFGLLKDHLNLKHCKNINDVKKEVTKQVNYYNYERPQLGLKKMPPILYRRHLLS